MKWNENLSYRFVALGVALILWMSMLSRKDSTLVREFDLQLMLPAAVELKNNIPDFVKVEVAGPRVALKKINQINPIFTVDLTSTTVGRHSIRLGKEGLTLPIGTRIVNIEPAEIDIDLRSVKAPQGEVK